MTAAKESVMEIRFDRELDPDGAKLRRLLEAYEVYERLGAARSFFVHLLALIGVIVWLDAKWPDFLPSQVHVLAFGLWDVFFCTALSISIGEWIWYRRQRYCRTHYHEKQKES
jgi:hypothetical protein